MKYLKLLMLISVICCSCQTENPFLDEEIVKAMLKEKEIKPIEQVAFIMDNDLYLLKNFDSVPVRITNSESISKRQPRYSHDHQKIAYLNNFGTPIIVDETGKIKEELNAFTNVKQMDWTYDDKTLYMLVGNQLKFYGNAIDVPQIIAEPEESVLSVAITKSNEVIYIVRSPLGFNRFTERVVKRSLSGETVTIEKQSGEIRNMQSLRLSKDGNFFVLCYSRSIYDKNFIKTEIYELNKIYPEITYDEVNVSDVLYDHNSKFMVTGLAENSSMDNSYLLTAIYTMNQANEEDKDKYKSDYKSVDGIQLDWK